MEDPSFLVTMAALMPVDFLIKELHESIHEYEEDISSEDKRMRVAGAASMVLISLVAESKGGNPIKNAMDLAEEVQQDIEWRNINPLKKDKQS